MEEESKEYPADEYQTDYEVALPWQPPPKIGYTRVYEDHTGRWYTDYPDTEMKAWEEGNSEGAELLRILNEEIRKEINNEILKKLKG